MKVVYLLQNAGIASRTPEGWESAALSPRPDGSYSERELADLAEADALVVGLHPVDRELLSRAPRVRLVQRLGVGYSNIDLDAAAGRGISVCNMPDFNSATVAEHTIMLMLALLRRVFDSTLLMKGGQWPVTTVAGLGIFDLQGRTLGLVGAGAIGRAVAERARPFGVRILYLDPHVPRDAIAGAERAGSLDELLAASDVVSLHVPLTPETRSLIGERELRLMKPTAFLVNTARGAVVDEPALVRALHERAIAGAGLDVFDDEPLDAGHPLRRCPNVLLTPHLAGQTREAMERMVSALRENLARTQRNEEPLFRVTALPST